MANVNIYIYKILIFVWSLYACCSIPTSQGDLQIFAAEFVSDGSLVCSSDLLFNKMFILLVRTSWLDASKLTS